MSPEQVKSALRNVVLMLQKDPLNYRNFGVYWWPVKKLLKVEYSREQLPFLGDYEDPEGVSFVPDMPLLDTLSAAFEEYTLNARYLLGRNTVDTPDGEHYVIYDQDVGA